MKINYESLVGKTCFYRELYASTTSTGIITSIEHRHNLQGEVSTIAFMENGDKAVINSLWFPGLPEQAL